MGLITKKLLNKGYVFKCVKIVFREGWINQGKLSENN